MSQTVNTPLHRPMVRLSSIVRVVGPAIAHRSSSLKAPESSQSRIVAAVYADWKSPAPVLAALTVFAFEFQHFQDKATLAIVTPIRPDEEDAIAVSVLLDALAPGHGYPNIVLMTEAEAGKTNVDTVFRPLGDESDLIGIAQLAIALHEIAQGMA